MTQNRHASSKLWVIVVPLIRRNMEWLSRRHMLIRRGCLVFIFMQSSGFLVLMSDNGKLRTILRKLRNSIRVAFRLGDVKPLAL